MNEDLIRRLRGEYRLQILDGLGTVGAGEEPNNPIEFVRKFPTPPIQQEAAKALVGLVEWEIRYKELFGDWVDFDDIENARKVFENK